MTNKTEKPKSLEELKKTKGSTCWANLIADKKEEANKTGKRTR